MSTSTAVKISKRLKLSFQVSGGAFVFRVHPVKRNSAVIHPNRIPSCVRGWPVRNYCHCYCTATAGRTRPTTLNQNHGDHYNRVRILCCRCYVRQQLHLCGNLGHFDINSSLSRALRDIPPFSGTNPTRLMTGTKRSASRSSIARPDVYHTLEGQASQA